MPDSQIPILEPGNPLNLSFLLLPRLRNRNINRLHCTQLQLFQSGLDLGAVANH